MEFQIKDQSRVEQKFDTDKRIKKNRKVDKIKMCNLVTVCM